METAWTVILIPVTRWTRFSFFVSLFLFFFSYIYTYKDHSLRLVVRRPYSGLTFSLILFFNIYICGLPCSHS